MMSVNAVDSGIQGIAGGNCSSGSSRLEALERKLSQLKDEKEKAVRNKDKEKEKKLEEEIQKVEKQIQQLKMKERKKEQENKGGGEKAAPGLGSMIDVYR